MRTQCEITLASYINNGCTAAATQCGRRQHVNNIQYLLAFSGNNVIHKFNSKRRAHRYSHDCWRCDLGIFAETARCTQSHALIITLINESKTICTPIGRHDLRAHFCIATEIDRIESGAGHIIQLAEAERCMAFWYVHLNLGSHSSHFIRRNSHVQRLRNGQCTRTATTRECATRFAFLLLFIFSRHSIRRKVVFLTLKATRLSTFEFLPKSSTEIPAPLCSPLKCQKSGRPKYDTASPPSIVMA